MCASRLMRADGERLVPRILARSRAAGVEHVIVERDAGPGDRIEEARRRYREVRRLGR